MTRPSTMLNYRSMARRRVQTGSAEPDTDLGRQRDLFALLRFTISGGKITAIGVPADPERLGRLG